MLVGFNPGGHDPVRRLHTVDGQSWPWRRSAGVEHYETVWKRRGSSPKREAVAIAANAASVAVTRHRGSYITYRQSHVSGGLVFSGSKRQPAARF